MNPAGKKLYRSETNRLIAGVCGGLAEYFETDPVLVRIIFLFLSLIGAGGIFLYLILWVMIPEKNEEHKNSAHDFAREVREHMNSSHNTVHSLLGIFIIMIGILLLVDQFFPGYGFEKFWPVLIILFGVLVMFRRTRRS